MRVFVAGATGVIGSRLIPLEHSVLDFGGAVLRYGQFYGPDTYYEHELPDHPRIHVDDAARQTMTALGLSHTMITIAESW